MSPAPSSNRYLRFGAFEIDLETCELRKNGLRIGLQDQPFRLLEALLERPGEVVTREELRRQIWTADTFVDFDRSLNTAALKIRQALGDSSTHPRFLETVPRQGYRFVAPVEPLPVTPAAAPSKSNELEPTRNAEPAARSNRRSLACAFVSGAAVMAALAWLGAIAREQTPPNPVLRIKPLTTFAGAESAPTWSPDGRFVAFSRFTPNDSNIFVMPVAGGDPVQLTFGAADDMRPRWSPDGSYIAFLSDEGQTKRVYLMPPLGGSPKMLADTNLPYLQKWSDSWRAFGTAPWSPDGQQLLFSRLQPNGTMAVWKVHVETNEEAPLTFPPPGADDQLASWSFDGKWIVFTRRLDGKGGLWIMPAGGGEPHALLRDQHHHLAPSFSSDSRRVVFQSNRGGPQNLWDIDITTGALRQLTNGPGMDLNAVVGRNGGLLFGHHTLDSSFYSIELSTGREESLTSNRGRNLQPRLSPDGKRIAYHSDRHGNFDVFLFDTRTKSERPLTNHTAVDVMPDWSPDGREIVFISDRNGPFQLWKLNVERGTNTLLLKYPVVGIGGLTPGEPSQPVASRWSPDGRKIGFLAPSGREKAVWSVDADGNNAKEILTGILAFDWYRDSHHLVFTRTVAEGSGVHEMCLIDLNTRQVVVLYRGPHIDLSAAKDGTGITYLSGGSQFSQNLFLLRLEPRGNTPMQLTNAMNGWYPRNGGWSSDSKSVIYLREQHEADIYLIENYH